MAEVLNSNVEQGGFWDGDIVKVLMNLRDVVNELQTDHATTKAITDETKTDYTAILADVTAIRAEVVKLVTDMASRITDHNTLRTKLNADAGVTDVDYAAAVAITAAAPAALTATALAASSPATLTNSTAITLNKG
jgi:hypothetical protein